ncbi:MAG: hypothetical protein HYV96_13635 [Opitutae bacterium]|nr:hypothetical protein [Opitutae bacterium]
MTYVPKAPQEQAVRRTNWVLIAVSAGFFALAAAFLSDLWGRPVPRPEIPLVDPAFLDQTAWRKSYADLVRAKEDLSDFSCYTCHDKGEPPPLRFDEQHNLLIPEEHETIKMGHGSHNRNNLCFNCHNETNLLSFSTREKSELTFAQSSRLCGSCHGPNYRDWEAGVHGRLNGYWNKSRGEARRLDCVNCHNPHSPRIPTRPPAQPPHSLRAPAAASHAAAAPTH